MYQFEKLKPEYAHLWAACKINPNKTKQFKDAAALIAKGEDTYKDLEQKTGVPWYLIGMIHLREGDCNFHTHLHNGDSLRYRTVHVPAGRPPNGTPPFTFEFSAIDALRYEGFDKIHTWSIEQVLYCLEKYNGFGYRQRGVPSAYVWAGTSNYRSGKFVSDGVFSSSAVDTQLGCAGVLKTLLDADVNIQIDSGVHESDMHRTYKAGSAEDDRAAVSTNLSQTSRKWSLSNIQQKVAAGFGGTAAIAQGFNWAKLQSMKEVLDFLKEFVLEYGLFIVIGICVATFGISWLMKKYMVEDVMDGRAVASGNSGVVDGGGTPVAQNV